jgi:diguanylate cyclase (GGDEF)-like protein
VLHRGGVIFMENIWEFYENMNEIVYVSDIDSNQLVYMNLKAREMYGVKSLEELKGRKCYEVLQGDSNRCAFCNNASLKVGQFDEWTFGNPVVGKKYMLKDTLVEQDGRRYRIELAIDISEQEEQKETIEEFINNEAVINEALRLSLSTNDTEKAINILLEYVGKALNSDRMYIFEEKPGDVFDNTYEWCAQGVVPQIDNLKNLSHEVTKIWLDRFQDGSNVIIHNLEDTKETDPLMYDYLLPQDIHSLVVSPLVFNNRINGFYGVDNPPEHLIKNISTLFMIMGHFLVSLLRRRDLFKKLENLSYHDQLTGLRNRYAMDEYTAKIKPGMSIGILNCDVMGLKVVNDSLGHHAGDEMLIRTAGCLREVFPKESVYRTGGDEFLVICVKISREQMEQDIEKLKEVMSKRNVSMAMGFVWSPDGMEESIDSLFVKADELMYNQKRDYYAAHPDKSKRRR